MRSQPSFVRTGGSNYFEESVPRSVLMVRNELKDHRMHTGNDLLESLITENMRLRALLKEAHRELSTIDAFTVTPTPPDEFFNLVRRIKEELEEG
jgi:hypothetical protein